MRKNMNRYINVHGTAGEVYGNMDEGVLFINIYGKAQKKVDITQMMKEMNVDITGGHGGGDGFLYKDFVDYISGKEDSFTRTTIDESIESHVIGFKAEESRLNNGNTITL